MSRAELTYWDQGQSSIILTDRYQIGSPKPNPYFVSVVMPVTCSIRLPVDLPNAIKRKRRHSNLRLDAIKTKIRRNVRV